MSLTHHTSPSATTRMWTVLALLLVLGAQMQEIAHYHSAGEQVSSCVHCHSTTGAAVPASIPPIPVIVAAAALLVALALAALPTRHRSQRGQGRAIKLPGPVCEAAR